MALAHLSNDTVRFTSFLFMMAITVVSMSEFNLLKSSRFLNSFELLGNRKNVHYHYGYSVYNQLQNKNHRCQCKHMHDNYFRITTALSHLTAVFNSCLWNLFPRISQLACCPADAGSNERSPNPLPCPAH